jgi:hypothetical protein
MQVLYFSYINDITKSLRPNVPAEREKESLQFRNLTTATMK